MNLSDIPGYTFISITPITKGWSGDKKYCVTDDNGVKYLLRLSPHDWITHRNPMFEMMKRVDSLGIPMCRPVAFGTCDEGVYSLQSWIDGEDLEALMPTLTEAEQYALGIQAGETLRKIHSIPAPETQEDWAVRFNRKTDWKIQKYQECEIKIDGGEAVIDYVNSHRDLLQNRPQCFQHGDYHIGNMMLENGKLVIIDWDRYDFGDPWEEFNRIVWCAGASPHFATGMVHGYFGGEPPIEFWKLLAFYISSNTLSSVYWAIPFGEKEVETMMTQSQDVLRWFDGMKNVVPTWYLSDWRVPPCPAT
jgi:aminoglycoside phosphotransferase (APT) family kinase protein